MTAEHNKALLKSEMSEPDTVLLKKMLAIAIQELAEIGNESDIWLIDKGKICRTEKQIYECLKRRVKGAS